MLATAELHGVAASLVRDAEDLTVGDLYLDGADAYDAVSATDRSEINEIIRMARGVTTPILELACGSGRLALPLLAAGHRVVGVDNAPRMIELFAERVSVRPRLADRLELIEADMAGLRCDRRFDLVYCGITSITVLPDDARRALFLNAGSHLTDDGRFVFSVLEIDGHGVDEHETVISAPCHGQTDLFVFFERVDHDARLRTVSILHQPLGPRGRRALYTTEVKLLDPDRLVGECQRAGLDVVAVRPVQELPGRTVRAVETRRSGSRRQRP
ncbi:MAG: daptide-type RiPP biosynthesis methyltransferase [Acidimicrobiales bacterium]